jgi:hypothetical protein
MLGINNQNKIYHLLEEEQNVRFAEDSGSEQRLVPCTTLTDGLWMIMKCVY